jgi:hypothetical protein
VKRYTPLRREPPRAWHPELGESLPHFPATGSSEIQQAEQVVIRSKSHVQFLQNSAPENIEIYEFAGINIPTIDRIMYKQIPVPNPQTGTKIAPDFTPTGIGDKTVVKQSALAQESATSYLIDLQAFPIFSHDSILNISSVQRMLEELVSSSNPATEFGIYPEDTEVPPQSYNAVQVFSPVAIELEDSEGRVTRTEEVPGLGIQLIREDIPGSYYLSVGETHMIVVPADKQYTVRMTGTANGSLQLELERYEGHRENDDDCRRGRYSSMGRDMFQKTRLKRRLLYKYLRF